MTIESFYYMQMGLAMLVWLVYGIWQFQRSRVLLEKMLRLSRNTRAVMGAVLLIAGALVLYLAFVAVTYFDAFPELKGARWLTPVGWAVIAVFGLLFVHAQTNAAAMLISLAFDKTNAEGSASSNRESEETK